MKKRYKEKKCIVCGKEFIPTTGSKLICNNKECYLINRRNKEKKRYRRNRPQRTATCPLCSKSFTTRVSKKKYCGSAKCERERQRRKNRRADSKRVDERKEYSFKRYYGNRDVVLQEKKRKYREGKEYKVKDGHSTEKVSVQKVFSTFGKDGYRVVTPPPEYKNTHSKLSVVCPEGHEWEVSYHSFYHASNRCYSCSLFKTISGPEKEIYEYLKLYFSDIILQDRSILRGKEIDIYIPSQNVGIEYCGLYWHGELSSGKNKRYHRDKTEACIERGIRLITIFEDEYLENKSAVFSRIKNALNIIDTKVHARKCTAAFVSPQQAAKFLSEYHLQGRSGTKERWGLFYKNQLVQVLTLGTLARKHTAGDKKIIELKRLASVSGAVIVGGVSKLFAVAKKWAKEGGYTHIKSYCDMRWANPFNPIYEILGFELLTETKYTPHYFKGQKRYRNQSLRKTPEERLTGKTEWELRQEQGYDRIWDCGHRTYVYTL